jgi:hypothetical protein
MSYGSCCLFVLMFVLYSAHSVANIGYIYICFYLRLGVTSHMIKTKLAMCAEPGNLATCTMFGLHRIGSGGRWWIKFDVSCIGYATHPNYHCTTVPE